MLNAMEAKKITKRNLIKRQKKIAKMLKRIKKEIQKGILTAINNGQYEYVCEYWYNNYVDRKTKLKGYSILDNEKYLKEYYQTLGYIIRIIGTGFSVQIEISWAEE